MNPTPTPADPIARERLIDRLVDGELTDDERRSLLLALDREPDGWKRCALAFLEAQAWRAACTAGDVAEPAPPGRQAPWRAAPGLRPSRLTALAAAVFVVFVMGATFGAAWNSVSAPVPGTGAHFTDTRPTPAAATAPVPSPTAPAPPLATAPASPQPPAVPDYLRRQLERQGYRVEGDRGLLSIRMEGGREVQIPVQSVKYQYVGHRIY